MRSAPAAARLGAMALDLAVIAGWALVAAAVGLVARRAGLRLTTPVTADAFAFTTLVLPSVVTFAAQEASPRHATFGKRRLRLAVVTAGGGAVTFGRALGRSAVKFLPWQLGHTATFHIAAGSTGTAFLTLSIVAQLLVIAALVTTVLDRQNRAPHDLIAGTRVVSRAGSARAGSRSGP